MSKGDDDLGAKMEALGAKIDALRETFADVRDLLALHRIDSMGARLGYMSDDHCLPDDALTRRWAIRAAAIDEELATYRGARPNGR